MLRCFCPLALSHLDTAGKKGNTAFKKMGGEPFLSDGLEKKEKGKKS
jgi:hypothetical protein